MQRRQFVQVTAAALGGASLAGCSADTEYEGGTTTGDGGGGSNKKLTILTHQMLRENVGSASESVKVTGTAENVSGDMLGYAEVKAKFYDENDALLESFLDNVNDLGDGEKWNFEVQYPGIGDDARKVASYKVGVGSSF